MQAEKQQQIKETGRRRTCRSLTRLQLGHFLHVDPDALAVKKHEVDGLDGGRHGGDKVAGNGLEDQLSRRLLRKTVPAAERESRHSGILE